MSGETSNECVSEIFLSNSTCTGQRNMNANVGWVVSITCTLLPVWVVYICVIMLKLV